MKEKLQNLKYQNQYFYWLWGVVCGGLTLLFERVVTMETTDFPQHIHCARGLFTDGEIFVLQGTAYQTYLLFHRTTKIISKVLFMDINLTAALLMAAVCAISILLMRWTVKKLFGELKAWQQYLVDLICIGSIFFENITGPLTGGRYYLLQGAPNPWHNPTYLMARPFGILTFAFFVLWIQKLWKGERAWKEGILYGVCVTVSVYAKPTYAFVLLPAFAIVTLVMMIAKKRWKQGWCVLLVTVPVIILLLWQFTICFADSLPEWMVPRQAYTMEELDAMELAEELETAEAVLEESTSDSSQTESAEASAADSSAGTAEETEELPAPKTFGFRFGQKFGAFDNFTVPQAVSVTIAACAVPLLSMLLALKYREICTNMPYVIAMLTLFIGWFERFFLTNGPHGDFAWGYFGAIQLATVISLVCILRSKAAKIWKWGSCIIYVYQIAVGVVYVYNIYHTAAFFV